MKEESREFFWTGVLSDGTKVKNEKVVALSREQVLNSLVAEGAYPTKISSGGGMNMSMNLGGGSAKLKVKARAEFARRLYQLLRAGVPVSRAIESLGEEAKDEIVLMCNDLSESVSAGIPLAEAMAGYPKAFDEIFCAYVAVGEQSGTLLVSLERLSILLAQRAAMQTKIRGVMAYPVMVGGTIGILTAAILLFLVPRFVDIYASFGADLPAPTLMVVALSKNILPLTTMGTTEAWMTLGIPAFPIAFNPVSITSLFFFAFLGWKLFRRQTSDDPKVNIFLNKIIFKMPMFGKLVFKSALYRWTSTLSGSLTAGVQAPNALEMASDAASSAWIESLTPGLVDATRSGRTMGSEMGKSPDVFPVNIRTMVSTGEATGDLTSMLDSVTTVLQEEIDGQVEGLSAKIEVLLLLVLGGVVGGLLMVLYLPILQLASSASDGLGG